jgi:hypothetical protein
VLTVNKDVSYRRTINCTKAVGLRTSAKYLYNVISKWENKISTVYRSLFNDALSSTDCIPSNEGMVSE